ncbi:uncharacterized protein [Aquarana catesbeiana]|uniref:uncharacterized protein isoform X3 n=1 Tax=Aquarana catesbeiana TaxID=8400 RepID=UPI003CCA4232
MNKIVIVLILSAMVTTGHLKTMCKRCWNLDSTECSTEKDTECDGTKCMMLSEYYNISNVIYNSVKKTCATDIMCDNCFSASTNHGFSLRVSGECREGDNSNAELEYKEQCHDKMPLNNFMCPSCYVNTSTDGCKSNGMVLCCGNEFECLKYRSLVQLSEFYILYVIGKGNDPSCLLCLKSLEPSNHMVRKYQCQYKAALQKVVVK